MTEFSAPELAEFYKKRSKVFFMALANTYRDNAWKTKYAIPGVQFWSGERFIVGIDTEKGVLWDTLPIDYWDKLNVEEIKCSKDRGNESIEDLIESLLKR